MGLMDEKASLRKQMRTRLKQISPDAAIQSAQALRKQILSLPETKEAKRILLCLSFGVEIDTWQLADDLIEAGKEVFVPRTDKGDTNIYVHPYPCKLEKLSFGLQQPLSSEALMQSSNPKKDLDLVLILALAFDKQAFRLGYGGGYFDRFLENRCFKAVGIGFDQQILDHVPQEKHDLPMDIVVTPTKIVRTE